MPPMVILSELRFKGHVTSVKCKTAPACPRSTGGQLVGDL